MIWSYSELLGEIKDEFVDWWLPVGEGRGEGQERGRGLRETNYVQNR